MHGQSLRCVGLNLTTILAACLSLPLFANRVQGAEIKLPPLRVKVGQKAPDFALPATNGKTVRLSDFKGRNVLIDFYRGYW